jgi:hypothetical protein
MRKIIFVLLFFTSVLVNLFSNENFNLRKFGYYTNFKISIAFSAHNIITVRESGSVKEGCYYTVSEQGIPFINITWNDNSTEKYLYLFYYNSGRILLYNNDAEPFFNGIHFSSLSEQHEYEGWGINPYGGSMFTTVDNITATSYLREGNIHYSPDISNLKIGSPWAVSRNGIGEKISFGLNQPVTVFLSSGFISYNRPHLYSQNSRPSRIRVSFGNTSYIFKLEDTPHFQSIYSEEHYFPFGARVEFEILDVYPGTRFSDVCITSILYYFSQ